jgi:hypothetical protein
MPAERVPLELHLDAMSSDERAIWDRFVELVEAAGPSQMIVTKSRIAFRAAYRIFAGGFFKERPARALLRPRRASAGSGAGRAFPSGLGARAAPLDTA